MSDTRTMLVQTNAIYTRGSSGECLPLVAPVDSHSGRIACCTRRLCLVLRTMSLQASVMAYTETDSACRDSNKRVATVRRSISHCTSQGFLVRHRGFEMRVSRRFWLTCTVIFEIFCITFFHEMSLYLHQFLPLPLVTICGSLSVFLTLLQDAVSSLGQASCVRGKRGH